MVVGRKVASVVLAVCAAWVYGCGDGLGECNEAALGGNVILGMSEPYDGQAIVAARCASGRCHSEAAEGAERLGAPADINFDVRAASGSDLDSAKLARAVGIVVDWSEDMWEEIDGDSMPPAKPAGSGPLSGAEKEAVRNWLACGAPVIGFDPSSIQPTWRSIWSGLEATNCLGCHAVGNASGGMGAELGSVGDACGAYDRIVGQVGVTEMCSGQTLIVPNQPQSSQLLLKIKADPAMCGMPMPQGFANGLSESNPELIEALEAWIMAGAMPPDDCP